MLRILAILLFVIIFVSFETSIFPFFSLFGVTPDLLLILVVIWGLLRGSKEAALLGFVVGIIEDILSSTLYFHALSKCLIGLGSGIFAQTLTGVGPFLGIVMVSIMTAASFFIDGVLLYFFLGHPVPQFLSLSIILFLSIIYNSLLTPIVYPIVKAFSLRLGEPEVSESFPLIRRNL